MLSRRARQSLVSLAFGAVLAAHLTWFTPLTLYLGNSDEFTVDFFTMLPYLAGFFAFISIPAALIALLLPPRAYRAYVALLAVLGLLIWFQGNFLVWDYGALDGRQIDWTHQVWRGWVDMSVWLVGLGLALRLQSLRRQLLLTAAIAVFALQIVTNGVLGVRDSSLLLRNDEVVPPDEALSQIHDFSRNKNVLHLILDGFQADIFEEIVGEDQGGQRIATALDGFVFYRNNLSAFPYTHMSLPALISGEIYRNHEPIKTFRQNTFGEKSILRTAQAAGYELDIAAMGELASWYRLGGYTNSFDVPNNLHVDPRQAEVDESARLLDLSLLRTLPHFVKRYVYNDQRWLIQPMVSHSRTNQLVFFSHRFFLRRWQDSMTATRDVPVYKMMHLMLSHNPMVANENCEFAGQVLYAERKNVLNQARCSLVETIRVLEQMKELDVYDDALIVIMGDHGAWTRPKGLKVEAGPDGTPKPMLLSSSQYALSMPLLAIKVPGSTGELRVSDAPTWTADVPDTISAALNFRDSFGRRNILAIAEDEHRERKFHVYDFERGELDSEYLQPIQEYVVNGDVYDLASWRRGELYPPGAKAE